MTREISGQLPRDRSSPCRTKSRSVAEAMTSMLAEYRHKVKRHAAKGEIRHLYRMATRKPPKPAKTLLNDRIRKRFDFILQAKGLSINAASQRTGAPAYETIRDLLRQPDCQVSTVSDLAESLGVAVWKLCDEDYDLRRDFPTNLSHLPHDPIIPPSTAKRSKKRSGDRNKPSA